MNARPTTLFEKVWEQHVVRREEGRPDLIYIDLHLVHEVTSPQAFAGLNAAGRAVRRPERTLATVDHNVPTTHRSLPVADPVATRQIEALRENAAEHGITLYDMGHERQGIVHVIGPELGATRPGMTIVCGDSHTSTTAPSGRSPSGSAPRRSSMCSPPSACSWSARAAWRSATAGASGRGSPPRT